VETQHVGPQLLVAERVVPKDALAIVDSAWTPRYDRGLVIIAARSEQRAYKKHR
jgi:hypothetical protein